MWAEADVCGLIGNARGLIRTQCGSSLLFIITECGLAKSDVCGSGGLCLRATTISEDELFLLYQPKTEFAADGRFRTVGYEALVRWNKPETGMVSPGEFIPAAEDSGQIVEVDRWVIKAAVAQLTQWLKEPQTPVLPVAINVSAALFSRSEFVDDLRAILDATGVPSSLIELEITEHAATVHIENTLKTLRELRAMGFRLAIDDFGTGYSSLSYLREFPIDHLKIDLSFVRDVHLDPKKTGIGEGDHRNGPFAGVDYNRRGSGKQRRA